MRLLAGARTRSDRARHAAESVICVRLRTEKARCRPIYKCIARRGLQARAAERCKRSRLIGPGARMPTISELPVPNLFLASLPQDDFEALRPHFERVRLSSGQVLHKMGSPIEYCYFTDGGMTSLVVDLEDGASIEVGVVGKEGFAGGAALMGFEDASPLTSMIQIP